MHLQSLKILCLTVNEMHLQNTVFDLGVNVTQDVAQCPLHHVTYAHMKFEAATSNVCEEMQSQEITLFDF